MNRRSILSLGLSLASLAAARADEFGPVQTMITPGALSPNLPRTLLGGPETPPECDRPTECRFVGGVASVTLMGCGVPVYDRAGNVELPKPCNTSTSEWSCRTCGKRWQEKSLR